MCTACCTETIVYNNYPREAAVSTYLVKIFERIASGVSWLLSSTVRSLTWEECSYPQLFLHWGLSHPKIAEPCFKQKTELGGKSPRYAQNPLWGSEGKHSTTHHAPSPLPHVIIRTSLSYQRPALFLSYYNVTLMTISAEQWRKCYK